jgi:hypothetical protein
LRDPDREAISAYRGDGERGHKKGREKEEGEDLVSPLAINLALALVKALHVPISTESRPRYFDLDQLLQPL